MTLDEWIGRRGSVVCPMCGERVPCDNFGTHVAWKCDLSGGVGSDGIDYCPICNQQFTSDEQRRKDGRKIVSRVKLAHHVYSMRNDPAHRVLAALRNLG